MGNGAGELREEGDLRAPVGRQRHDRYRPYLDRGIETVDKVQLVGQLEDDAVIGPKPFVDEVEGKPRSPCPKLPVGHVPALAGQRDPIAVSGDGPVQLFPYGLVDPETFFSVELYKSFRIGHEAFEHGTLLAMSCAPFTGIFPPSSPRRRPSRRRRSAGSPCSGTGSPRAPFAPRRSSVRGSHRAGPSPPSPCPACRSRTGWHVAFTKASCTGWSFAPLARPSIVVISLPWAATARTRQDATGLPSMSTVQAPHSPFVARLLRARQTDRISQDLDERPVYLHTNIVADAIDFQYHILLHIPSVLSGYSLQCLHNGPSREYLYHAAPIFEGCPYVRDGPALHARDPCRLGGNSLLIALSTSWASTSGTLIGVGATAPRAMRASLQTSLPASSVRQAATPTRARSMACLRMSFR